ncbi:MAG: TonB-dependent receptor, partial [Solirubrobacteraceae bacterium]
MRFSFLVFFLFIFSFGITAQNNSCNFSVSGKILDSETKEPITNVSVKIKGTEISTVSNNNGDFVINDLCSKENTLIISCMGYCESSACEHLHHQHENMSHIYLTKEVLNLTPIIIQSKKPKELGIKSIAQVNISKSDLGLDPTQSLASVLSREQGVTFISNGNNVQLPVIHGLYGNRILILNNGLKHGFQNWGTDHSPEIDISSANNIILVKGASGVRFGPEAIGGAIIVESNKLHLSNPLNIEIGSGFQTNGKGINTNVSIAEGFKDWGYYVNGNFTKIGDRNTPNYQLTNSGKEEQSFGFGSMYHLEKWDFKINYSYLNQNLALLRSSIANSGNAFVRSINSNEPNFINPFSYDINAPNQQINHHFGKVEVNWFYSNKGKLTFRAGRQINKREEYDVRRNIEKPIIDLDLTTSDYQIEWKHPDWLKLDGMVGLQYFNQDNNNNPGTGTTPFIPNYNMDRYSAFIIESKKFGKNLIEAGFRFDYEANNVRGREVNQELFKDNYTFNNLTSTLGYVREISENSTFRTNIGTAWRSPNMAELFSFGQHGFKNTYGLLRYYTNSNGELSTDKVIKLSESTIKPEIGYKFINEFQTTKNKNTHTLTAYSHYIENYIFDRPFGILGTIRGSMPGFILDQTNAFFLGADYSWKKDWTRQLSGVFGFSYLWSRDINKNQPLINQPPISTNYLFTWKHGELGKLTDSKISINPSYTFRQFQSPRTINPEKLIDGTEIITMNSEIFDFKDSPKGYFLLDVSWAMK